MELLTITLILTNLILSDFYITYKLQHLELFYILYIKKDNRH
jgi:hypothetical protein